ASDDSLKEIIETVKRQETTGFESLPAPLSTIGEGLMVTYVGKIYRFPKKFNVTDVCNACGTCVKVCPVGNITLINKKVIWADNCTHCMACFHWCPKTAIQIGSKSANIARYHHPAIKVNDMIK
ncbi:MAG TPA: EFR1 family ferrodoxin, partial [Methanocellaceae archaeon]